MILIVTLPILVARDREVATVDTVLRMSIAPRSR